MTFHSLPLFVRLAGRPVILLGTGEAADAKRRLLDRAGAMVVGEHADAVLAIVAIDEEAEALAAIGRLKARGVLVNAVDRPDQCDFTLPALVDRAPVIVAIGTGGVSAGLAAALRQRFESLLPAGLGLLAEALHAMRGELRARYPAAADRRRVIASALMEGGLLDPFRHAGPIDPRAMSLEDERTPEQVRGDETTRMVLASQDPDDLTLRQARALANADRVIHDPHVPPAILDRARADAQRLPAPADPGVGLTVIVTMA